MLKQFHCRNRAEIEYIELKREFDGFQISAEEEHRSPTSEFDQPIAKQKYFNETLVTQVRIPFFRSEFVIIRS